MRKLGKKRLTLQLQQRLAAIPAELSAFKLSIGDDGSTLIYDYDTKAERTGVATLLGELSRAGLRIRDLQTEQSSLEDIFVGLVSDRR
jgi:ABC-2 type transport system ATP-binding protein